MNDFWKSYGITALEDGPGYACYPLFGTAVLGEKYYILGFLPAVALVLAVMYLPWCAAARRQR